MGYFDTADPTIKPKINTHETEQTGPSEVFKSIHDTKLNDLHKAQSEGFVTKDSGERKIFKSGMQRDTAIGKLLWHLAAFGPMLRRWVALLTRGAIKYDENNWMKANGQEELDRFRASAFRHFMQWFYGDDPSEDHAAAVFFNINGAEYVKDKLKTFSDSDISVPRRIEISEAQIPFVEPELKRAGRPGYVEPHSSYEHRRSETRGEMSVRHNREILQHVQWQKDKLTNGNLGGARA